MIVIVKEICDYEGLEEYVKRAVYPERFYTFSEQLVAVAFTLKGLMFKAVWPNPVPDEECVKIHQILGDNRFVYVDEINGV